MKTSFNNWSSLEKYFSDIIILQIDDVIFEWLHISNEKRKKKLRIRLRLNQFSTEKFERRKLKWIKKTSWNSNKNKIRLQQTIKIHFLLSVSSAVSYKKSQYFKSFFIYIFNHNLLFAYTSKRTKFFSDDFHLPIVSCAHKNFMPFYENSSLKWGKEENQKIHLRN